MTIVRLAVLMSAATTATVLTQSPPSKTAVTFEVVSIKRNTSGAIGSNGSSERPDGGFTMRNVPISTLIARAYPNKMAVPISLTSGLPDWAKPRGKIVRDTIVVDHIERPTED